MVKEWQWLMSTAMILLPLTAMASQTILVFGDSLSAAYGIPRDAGWTSLLEKKLAQEKPRWKLVNASVSGETTSSGLHRIGTTLDQHKPAVVILELGANDGLRGLPVTEMQRNLGAIIQACQKAKTRVLLVGMKIPPNYGIRYSQDFSATFPMLAGKFKTRLVLFLLQGVAGDPALIQADGLHPLAQAQPRLLQNVWPELQPLLAR